MGRKKKNQQTEQSSEAEEESENQKQQKKLYRPTIDRILKDNTNLKKIVINVSMTQYPVVTQVAQQLNWKIQTDPLAGDWDVFWTDYSIEPDILIRMHFHQKINHYPGIYTIARKNLLGLNLMALRNHFPDQYNFFPLTWMLPSQYSEFRLYYQSVTKGKVRTYIVKPEAECQGRGIFLTRNIEDLENGRHYVIQRYVTKPYLIDGLKFDLRIYVLLCGTDPLRVYLFQEGLARFATQPYVQPNSSNLDQTYVHLTNYAINKLNPKFVFNKSVNDMSTGHKRSMTSVYKLLERKGQNVALLKSKIKDVIIKTLITSLPLMSHQYRYSQPEEYSGNMCFHILGVDILITQSFQPLLLEINHTPSFATDTPLDTHIKHKLIKDSLVLMNINSKTKSALFQQAKQYNRERLHTGKRQIFSGEQKDREVQKAQKIRDEYQSKHLGGFQLIHPVKDQELQAKYNGIIATATKLYSEQNTLRARLEEKQAKKMFKQQRQMLKKQAKNRQPATTLTDLSKQKKPAVEKAAGKVTSCRNVQTRTNTQSKASSNTTVQKQTRLSSNKATVAASQKTRPNYNKSGVTGTLFQSSRLTVKSQIKQTHQSIQEGQLAKGQLGNNVIYNTSTLSNGSGSMIESFQIVTEQRRAISNLVGPGKSIDHQKYSKIKIRKASSHAVQLPYLPSDDNTLSNNTRSSQVSQGPLLVESEAVMEGIAARNLNNVVKVATTSNPFAYQKVSSHNFKGKPTVADLTRNAQHRSKTSKIKKGTCSIVGDTEEFRLFNRGGAGGAAFKTGNFLMPKIFDLNVCIREEEQHQIMRNPGVLKTGTISSGNNSQ